jgi:hypothetical protein
MSGCGRADRIFMTDEDALLYCRETEQRCPVWLWDLRQWLVDTGGPLAELDGTVESLVPLWGWCVDFIESGFPGVPAEPPLGWVPAPDDHESAPTPAQAWEFVRFSDALAAYLAAVSTRIDPGVQWEVLKLPRTFDHNSPYLRFSDGSGIGPHSAIAPLLGRAVNRNLRDRGDSGALREAFLRALPPQWRPGDQPRGESVLRTLPPARPSEPPLPVFSSGLPWTADAAGRATGERRHFDYLTIVSTDDLDLLDEPNRLRPLDADLVAAALIRLGFHPASDPQRTDVDLNSSEVGGDLWVRDRAAAEAEVSLEVVDGAVRTVNVEPVDMDPPEAAALINEFTGLAKSLGARVVTEGD